MMYAICTNATLMMVIAVSVLIFKEIRVIAINFPTVVVIRSACLIIVILTTIHVIIPLSKTQHTYMLTEVPYK